MKDIVKYDVTLVFDNDSMPALFYCMTERKGECYPERKQVP